MYRTFFYQQVTNGGLFTIAGAVVDPVPEEVEFVSGEGFGDDGLVEGVEVSERGIGKDGVEDALRCVTRLDAEAIGDSARGDRDELCIAVGGGEVEGGGGMADAVTSRATLAVEDSGLYGGIHADVGERKGVKVDANGIIERERGDVDAIESDDALAYGVDDAEFNGPDGGFNTTEHEVLVGNGWHVLGDGGIGGAFLEPCDDDVVFFGPGIEARERSCHAHDVAFLLYAA
jgi:hypothetical protein